MATNDELNQHNIITQRRYDALEETLAERPVLRAPKNNMASIMAQIAATPQRDALEQALTERPPLQAPATTMASIMAQIALAPQYDALEQALTERPTLQAPATTMASVMAQIALAPQYDALEQALTERPTLQAPATTMANVMARLAVLPIAAIESLEAAEAVAESPQVKYYPPVISQPLPDVAVEPVVVARDGLRHVRFGIFASAWVTLCLALTYLIWPAVSNLIFGPSSDPSMMARLNLLQGWWNNFSGIIASVVQMAIPLLPSALSFVVGLTILILILNRTQQQRLWRE